MSIDISVKVPENPKLASVTDVIVTVSNSFHVESDELTTIEVNTPPLAVIVTLAVLWFESSVILVVAEALLGVPPPVKVKLAPTLNDPIESHSSPPLIVTGKQLI